MIHSMERLTFASSLDLNMSYYHIKLDHDADAQRECMIVFPCGKYKYKRFSMSITILVWITNIQWSSIYCFSLG
jgi:hypothetical protein